MKSDNLALKVVQNEAAKIEEASVRKQPWGLHRLIRVGPSIDIRCSNTVFTKEKGKESL